MKKSDVRETAHKKILEYTEGRWGHVILEDALEEFRDLTGLTIDFSDGPEADDLSLFMTWFMFHYDVPDVSWDEHEELKTKWKNGEIAYYSVTPAQQLLAKRNKTLNAAEKEYIEQQLNRLFSFFQILSLENTTAETKDLITGEKITLRIPKFYANILKPEEIIFSKPILQNNVQVPAVIGDAIFKPPVLQEILESATDLNQEQNLEEPLNINLSVLNHYGFLRCT